MPLPRYAFHNVPLTDVDFLSLQLQIPKLLVYQAICDVLEQDGRLTEAIQCFQKMQNDLTKDTSMYTAWEVGEWVQGGLSIQGHSKYSEQTFDVAVRKSWKIWAMHRWTLKNTTRLSNTIPSC